MFSLLALIVYMSLELLRPEIVFPGISEQLMLWTAVATAAIWALEFLISGLEWQSFPSNRFLVAFVLAGSFSSLLAGDAGSEVLSNLVALSKLLFVYIVVVQSVKTPGRLALLRRVLLALILILCIGGIAFWRGHPVPGFNLDNEGRLQYTGIFADSNDLAQVYTIGWAMLLFDLANGTGKIRRLFVLGFLWALGTGIFLTQSRGAILGALVALVLAFRKRAGLAIPGVLALGLLLAMHQLGVARMDQLSTGESSAEGRILAWAQGWYMLRSNPVFGVGPENFREYHSRAAHSTLVQIAAETGMVGFFCWLGFLYFPLRDALLNFWRGSPEGGETPFHVGQLQSALMVCFVTGLFLSRGYVSLIYLLAGMVVVARRLYGEEPEFDAAFSWLDLRRLTIMQGASLLYWRFMIRGYVNGI